MSPSSPRARVPSPVLFQAPPAGYNPRDSPSPPRSKASSQPASESPALPSSDSSPAASESLESWGPASLVRSRSPDRDLCSLAWTSSPTLYSAPSSFLSSHEQSNPRPAITSRTLASTSTKWEDLDFGL